MSAAAYWAAMRLLAPLAMLLVAGCITKGPLGANVTGNAVSVTVNNVWNRNQAFPLADEHCAKYGKAARAADSDGDFAFAFDCVTP